MSQDPGVYDQDIDNPYRPPVADVGPQKPSYGQYTGYAGFWVRFVASFIDQIVVGIAGALVGVIAGILMVGAGTDPESVGAQVLLQLVGVLINLAYFAGMESSDAQATLGKMAMGLKVTDVYGRRISFGRAVGRTLGKILSGLLLGIGYLMVAFDDRKQGLHDKLASTLVMRTR